MDDLANPMAKAMLWYALTKKKIFDEDKELFLAIWKHLSQNFSEEDREFMEKLPEPVSKDWFDSIFSNFMRTRDNNESIMDEICVELVMNPIRILEADKIFEEFPEFYNDFFKYLKEYSTDTTNDLFFDGSGLDYWINLMYERIELTLGFQPAVIKINRDICDFEYYYTQAVEAYLHRLYGASMIIIVSFLENILKEKLKEFELDPAIDLRWETDDKGNKKPIGVCSKFIDLIDKCYAEEIIDKSDKDELHKMRKLRNDVVHDGKKVESKQVLDSLIKMTEIFENQFTNEEQ